MHVLFMTYEIFWTLYPMILYPVILYPVIMKDNYNLCFDEVDFHILQNLIKIVYDH